MKPLFRLEEILSQGLELFFLVALCRAVRKCDDLAKANDVWLRPRLPLNHSSPITESGARRKFLFLNYLCRLLIFVILASRNFWNQ